MTKETLETWRNRAPIIILGAFAAPYLLLTGKSLQDVVASYKVFVELGALALGALYVGMDFRRALWHRELRTHIGPQIQDSLLDMLPRDLEVTAEERAILSRQDVYKPLTGVFWEAVARDPELTAHKQHFYANGAKYTTAIDVYILGVCASLCYQAAYYFGTRRLGFMGMAFALVSIALISRLAVLPRCRKRHLELSVEQLDLLRRNQRPFVEKRFRDLVLERRRSGLLGSP